MTLKRLNSVVLLMLFFWLPVAADQTSLTLSPPPESKVAAADLVVSISISGPLSKTMELGQAQLFVNDRNVTGLSLRSDSYLSFRPLSTLQPGPVKARLEFRNGVVREWTFEVTPSQLIKSVTHNAKEALGQYQELVVTMKGEPGLNAYFTLGDKSKKYPMTEPSRGVYRGIYVVKPRDYFLGEKVTGFLDLGEEVEQRVAEDPASIFGHIFRVHIISPKSGIGMPSQFKIRGRTRPGSKVTLVPRISFNRGTRAPTSAGSVSGVNNNTGAGGSEGGISARADEEGYFEVDYGIPLKLPNLSVVISVFAVTPNRERSVPTVLRYSW